MSFSSIPSFRSGTASPAKGTASIQSSALNAAISPSSLASQGSPIALHSPSAIPQTQTPINTPGHFIPWTTNQGKLYKNVGDEAWKRAEKIVTEQLILILLLIICLCYSEEFGVVYIYLWCNCGANV